MEEEFNALKKVYGETAHALVLYESIERINLDEDFNLLGDFLEGFLGLELRQVKFLLKDHHESLQNLTQETIARLKKVLEKNTVFLVLLFYPMLKAITPGKLP